MLGIKPTTSWLVVRHADHSVIEAVKDINCFASVPSLIMMFSEDVHWFLNFESTKKDDIVIIKYDNKKYNKIKGKPGKV